MRKCLMLVMMAGATGAATASVPLAPASYDMLNGETGTFTYWDDTYNGSGDPTDSLSPLSGGLGDLTDGVIAFDNWFASPREYVGWQSINPTITFRFSSDVTVETIVIYADDSNGNGGVTPPSLVNLVAGGQNLDFSVSDPDDGLVIAIIINLDNGGITDNQFELTFTEGTSGWIMLSEIEFYGVPTPGAAPLLAFAGLAAARRRR